MKNTVNGPQWEPAKRYVVDSETVKSISASAVFEVNDKDKTKSFAIDNQALMDIEQLVTAYGGASQPLENYNVQDGKYRVGAFFAEGYLSTPDTTKGGTSQKTSMVGHLAS